MNDECKQAAIAYAAALECLQAAEESANISNEQTIAARYAEHIASNATKAAHAALEAALARARNENEG